MQDALHPPEDAHKLTAHTELRTVLQVGTFDAPFADEGAVGATQIFQAGARAIDGRVT